MKNITVSVDAETHRRARIRAAELETSVSALVREYLVDLTGSRDRPTGAQVGETEADRRARGIREVIDEITADGGGLRMAENLPRDQLHDRDRARAEAREASTESEKWRRG